MSYVPRILGLDYEVAPWKALCYGKKHEPRVVRFLEHQFLLCGSYFWFHEGIVRTKALTDFPGYEKDKKDDRKLAEFFRDLIDQADVVTAYNGKSFDFKQLATRLVHHGLSQHKPIKQHDPLLVFRNKLYLPSNSLEDVVDFLGVGEKGHTSDDTVFAAMNGDRKAWKDLLRYCKQDSVLLLEVYKYTRALSTGAQHPNLNIFTGDDSCPSCSSMNLHKKHQGELLLSGRVRYRYECQNCGKWCSKYDDEPRDRKPILVR